MKRPRVLLIATVGVLLSAGSLAISAQEPPSAGAEPSSPEDCLQDTRKAAECLRLGLLYAKGEEVPQDVAMGLEYLDATCRAGWTRACAEEGQLLLARHETPEEARRGLQLLQSACVHSDIEGCEALARAYAEGVFVPRDAAKVADAFDAACTNGGVSACSALAALLVAGQGVPRDAKRAGSALGRACALGEDAACEKACAAGEAAACRLLAAHAPDDDARAFALYQRACQAGDPWSCSAAVRRAAPVPDYDEPPRLLRQTKPQYTRAAFTRRIAGTVFLKILIDRRGAVSDVRIVGGVPGLDASAVECVRQWRFAPARRNGVAVPTIADAPITFNLT